ncbi:hypothetical protein NEMBOFW57_001697 [Staphylotrichum longicolle]|uniref:Proteophosphoglycan ppg4 n=1 Tax=Staphylotrichum longicolle TaxID=669026 RepID=A0AAD4I412_9PEZI|nr:hypothetical protein NEMBOFW57_001697 [Staphylotrichum longicolle]
MTRASSMTYESAVAFYGPAGSENRLAHSDSRASWNYNLTSYEAKRLLNLAEEPGLEYATTMSENRMTTVTETTWKSSNPAHHPPSAPITRASSDVSLYMPVRRRSIIQTPGVATRSSSTRDLPPLPQPNVRYSHPPTPSLSRKQSVESYRSGVMSMPPRMQDIDCVPRVVTPCEDKYLSIGAFKLGSLRITNGSPSPLTPDIDKTLADKGASADEAIVRDGYFSGVQASESNALAGPPTQDRVLSPRFLTEISQSPSSSPTRAQPASLALQTTSKATALEDELFEDEAQPEYSSVEVLDIRLDPNAKPPHAQAHGRDAGASVSRTDSGFVSITSPVSETPHKPLAKADSGYSSNVSLRSFQAKPQAVDDQPSTRRTAPVGSARQRSSSQNGSGPSVGGGPQKPGRLQRLLSGARRPGAGLPIVQTTRVPEQESIPPVPEDAEHKLQERGGRFPTTAKKLALKSRSSLDTLKTIFSVGSMEAGLDAVNGLQSVPAASESESNEGLWKQTLHSVPTSLANVAAHVIPRKPIARKPVPVRLESTREKEQGKGVAGREGHVHGTAPAADAATPIRSPSSSRRAMSLTFLGERGMKLRRRVSDLNLARSTADLPSPALPSPVAKAMSAEGDTRRPRSTSATRRPQSLRVPPPLRSQSSNASLSRKASRESIQSYPAMHTLAHKSSMDSFHSYASSQPGVGSGSVHSMSSSGMSMDPRRLQSFRQYHIPQSSPYNSPDWEVQTDHGMGNRLSQTFTASGSRRNSISSVQSEGGFHPGSAQGWQVRNPQQLLRHRASYDGYSYQQHRFSQHGHPPSMSNGYTAPVKPAHGPYGRVPLNAASTWSRSQVDAAAGQRYQGGQYHPYVPRGHHRNRSMGNRSVHGPNPPYRVLHSYNSPAYRNAPIWG